MIDLLDQLSTALAKKLPQVITGFSPEDRKKLEKLMLSYEKDCSVYRDLMETDQIAVASSELEELGAFFPKINKVKADQMLPLFNDLAECVEERIAWFELDNPAEGYLHSSRAPSDDEEDDFPDDINMEEGSADSDYDFFDPDYFGMEDD